MTTQSNLIKGLLRGIPVSEGIAIGTVYLIQSVWDEVSDYTIDQKQLNNEIARYESALAFAAQQLQDCRDRVKKDIGLEESKIFDAHLAILNDPFFQDEIPATVKATLQNTESVLKKGIERFIETFSAMTDTYISQRIDDIKDVAQRLLRILLKTEDSGLTLGEASILIAHHLTPSDTARIDAKKIIGFATEMGGVTSHVSILARSMGLPAVIGVERLLKQAKHGDKVIVDGNSGVVYVDPPQRVIKGYEKQRGQYIDYWKQLSLDIDLPSETLDHVRIGLYANISMTADVSMAARYKAAGIGLFRTELPFLISGHLLKEEEQFQLYKTIAEVMGNKPVTIRTLDLGGDKFLPFQDVGSEVNPFLGWRSIRISLQDIEEFKKQLRAILRASHYGNLRILYPMISSLEEIHEINVVLDECKAELKKKKIPFDESLPQGIMVEVPSAAVCADRLVNHADFLSIGTNDLIQYTLAVDRNNEKVAKFYQPLNPAILRLIYTAIQAANKNGKHISICGEMAGNPIYAPMFLGFGLREFSMSPVMLPELKERIRVVSIEECEELAQRILDMELSSDIKKALWDFHLKVNRRQTVPYIVKSNDHYAAELDMEMLGNPL